MSLSQEPPRPPRSANLMPPSFHPGTSKKTAAWAALETPLAARQLLQTGNLALHFLGWQRCLAPIPPACSALLSTPLHQTPRFEGGGGKCVGAGGTPSQPRERRRTWRLAASAISATLLHGREFEDSIFPSRSPQRLGVGWGCPRPPTASWVSSRLLNPLRAHGHRLWHPPFPLHRP